MLIWVYGLSSLLVAVVAIFWVGCYSWYYSSTCPQNFSEIFRDVVLVAFDVVFDAVFDLFLDVVDMIDVYVVALN